eukprot:TRINITY_DN7147_c0_g1_i1.p1 TRINITY_DN7147_c0_g1~~TRINITY_DN7147_c0_g1_i1.p1  ORF type:complete len:707 (-),score=113.02 TRINITY_DN7147_c0_g1_i1:719-2839(-)
MSFSPRVAHFTPRAVTRTESGFLRWGQGQRCLEAAADDEASPAASVGSREEADGSPLGAGSPSGFSASDAEGDRKGGRIAFASTLVLGISAIVACVYGLCLLSRMAPRSQGSTAAALAAELERGGVAQARSWSAASEDFLRAKIGEPNPPVWPSSVHIFQPEDDPKQIEAIVQAAYAKNGGTSGTRDHGQFSTGRYAFLFKPGTYAVDVPVGYYTQVAGLGAHPSDVVFTAPKGVHCEEGGYNYTVGALNTFWRSAENFQTNASYGWNSNALSQMAGSGMLWAVSQASPLRRIIVEKDLLLYESAMPSRGGSWTVGHGKPGWASGGFLGNTKVKGNVVGGTQQQWLTRNSEIGAWVNHGWNIVFVGTEGAQPSHCGTFQGFPFVTVDAAPRVVEKPFISIDASGKYWLNVPKVRHNARGVDFNESNLLKIDFEHVYVASDKDDAATLNSKLDAGLHIVLSPGIYELDRPLSLRKDGQVLLGLGMATLRPTHGNALVRVGNIAGARVAGVLLEAGTMTSDFLLSWGDGSFAGDAENPGALHDVFMRVGGPTKDARAEVMLRLDSGHVIGDNVWLWRADHGKDYVTKDKENPVNVGALIGGSDVTMYGLFAEHSLQDQVQWSGDRGAVYMLQMELPYDADEEYTAGRYVGLYSGLFEKSTSLPLSPRPEVTACWQQRHDLRSPRCWSLPFLPRPSCASGVWNRCSRGA